MTATLKGLNSRVAVAKPRTLKNVSVIAVERNEMLATRCPERETKHRPCIRYRTSIDRSNWCRDHVERKIETATHR